MRTGLVIMITVLLGAAILAAGGCAGQTPDSGPGIDPEEETQNPELVVAEFVTAIRDLDLEKARSFLSRNYTVKFNREIAVLAQALEQDDPESMIRREIFRELLHNIDIKITGHTVNEDEAVVYTLNTHPDPGQFGEELMGRVIGVMFSPEVSMEELTEEEQVELFLGIFLEVIETVEKTTTEIAVPMIMEEKEWKIDGSVLAHITGELDF